MGFRFKRNLAEIWAIEWLSPLITVHHHRGIVGIDERERSAAGAADTIVGIDTHENLLAQDC